MNPGVVAAAGLLGVLLGPLLRRQVVRYAVPAGDSREVRADSAGAVGCPSAGRVGVVAGMVFAVLAGIVFAALAARVEEPLPLLAHLWIAGFGIVLGFVDVAVRRLPDRLTLPAAAGAAGLLGVAAVGSGEFGRYAVAVACALALAGAYLGLVLLSPGGLGPGDAKLALGLGLVTGWYGGGTTLTGALAGLLLASGYAAVLLRLRRIDRRHHLPHGPAMLTGAFGAVLLAA
ncbi:prepilin peptidase [Plantactinospora endophytica]|uniref:Prepilin peptidase n=1 Tax=Plantactinospora endophytica TaxID=673535 RepID=A0ABQ4E3Y4_9ACTN|nr:prepilin peptidase [Plantactinospora endophytica]GIG89011.1 prepilin peptidase [Plantactinospora endophytica]